jgi:hypothetical protein
MGQVLQGSQRGVLGRSVARVARAGDMSAAWKGGVAGAVAAPGPRHEGKWASSSSARLLLLEVVEALQRGPGRGGRTGEGAGEPVANRCTL